MLFLLLLLTKYRALRGCLLVCLVIPTEVYANFINEPYVLNINWHHTHDYAMPDMDILEKEWPGLCQEIGKSFVTPSGIWSQGVFLEFNCHNLNCRFN